MSATATIQDRPAWGRGVLASYVRMMSRATDDISRLRVTLRDVVILLAGAGAMFAAQTSRDRGLQAGIDNLTTLVQGYERQQVETDSALQRQIDQARQQAALAIVNDANTAKELSELKGFLEGAGIKRVVK